jgi:hypothetical protein
LPTKTQSIDLNLLIGDNELNPLVPVWINSKGAVMESRISSSTIAILALAIIFSLPALACSILTSNSPKLNKNDQETKMAANVEASLTANAETQAAQATPTPSVTITPPPSPTLPLPPVLTDTLEPTSLPTKAATATPSGSWIGVITFAKGITADNQPIEPGTVFKRGVTEIYAVFPYSGIEQGKKITYYWTVNGKEFVSVIRTWTWDSSGVHPTSVGYSNNSSLDSGNWKLAIFYENKLLATGTFKITP